MRVATWNVGGLTAQNALDLPKLFVGHSRLDAVHVLVLQEIICEAGIHFHEQNGWVLVHGKNEGDWRGTGVAYKSAEHGHTNTKLLPAGLATTLAAKGGKRGIRFLAGHIPHHSTIAQAEAIMSAWEHTMQKARLMLGFDANETFTDEDGEGPRGHTGRGEVILQAVATCGGRVGPQQIDTPTYHPYNTAMQSRRIDYLVTRGVQVQAGGVAEGSRHIAKSDHDAVWQDIHTHPVPKPKKPTWGARRFTENSKPTETAKAPLPQTDTHTAIGGIARRLTQPGRHTSNFRESTALKQARRTAHQAPPHEARQAWKAVSRMRKQEMRVWHDGMVREASKLDWQAYRTLGHHQRRQGWQHHLVDQQGWQSQLREHFGGIFAKAPPQRTARRLGATREALTQLCKRTPWRPFNDIDLRMATLKWKRGKATGPDAISHEVLLLLLQEPTWAGRMLHMMNDMLYKGSIPQPIQQGADDLEGALNAAQPLLGPARGPPPPQSGGSFMDDTYLWSHDRGHLQYALAELERRLGGHGLAINPSKTAIIYSEKAGGGEFLIGGAQVGCMPFGTVITALGSPITFGEGVAAIVTAMNHRARRAFQKNSKLLCAPTPLKARIHLHQALVRGAALWGGQSWPVTEAILRAINSTQLQQIRRMMHPARRPGEEWGEWNVRTLRGARVALQQSKVVRWSTFQLGHTWDLYGHMARAKHGGTAMLQWKNLQWWEAEKAKPRRIKEQHARRYNSQVDTERQLVKIATNNWMQVAQSPVVWHNLQEAFIKQYDPPWATGKQGSLGNLTPNRTTGNRGGSRANEAIC
ncbi:unnamed protein product [Symbiodinium sp. CCMP2456]|nr:unnamed protein product [Symbiodinium sp. CCMP2456]